jgi:hypothetical protein
MEDPTMIQQSTFLTIRARLVADYRQKRLKGLR